MEWIKIVLKELSLGNDVRLIGKGNSMSPLIKDTDTITITPYTSQLLQKEDIVLVRLNNKYLTHKILDIQNDKYVISNMKNKIDGVCDISSILGIIIEINSQSPFSGITVEEIV